MNVQKNQPRPATDRVKISDLHVETVIGFYHWEHEEPQPLLIDLALGTNFDQVFQTGSLEHTLDYKKISQSIKKLCMESRFHLMEELTKAILEKLFNTYPVSDVHLSIRKPHALRSAIASIECYRTREEFAKISKPNHK